MLALVIALAGSLHGLITDWWWLGALALVALGGTAAGHLLPRTWFRAAGEMIMASVVIALGLPDAYVGMPYLALPAFAGGLSAGLSGAALTTLTGAAGLTVGLALTRNVPPDVSAAVQLFGWLIIIFVTGVVGAWVHRQETIQEADSVRYAAAYRLLSELRLVARRLSAGLDPTTLAERLLDSLATRAPVRRSAVLVRREGGSLVPMATWGGDDAWLSGIGDDPAVLEAWTGEVPTSSRPGPGAYRTVVPLRVSTHTTGVIVVDLAEEITADDLADAIPAIDEDALRLETAVLFDEVREIATREERRRVAREIHDGVAQELASLAYVVDDVMARTRDPEVSEQLATIRSELTRVLSDFRHSIFDLRSSTNRDSRLGMALTGYARDVGVSAGLKVHMTHVETHDRLHPEAEAELLRIGQEAITNVRKHARAQNLWVTVTVNPPGAHLRVADDGVGIGSRPPGRFGLDIMSERARRIGARLKIGSGPEGGTVVDVSLGPAREEG
jgi:signal transduction histidine kinase